MLIEALAGVLQTEEGCKQARQLIYTQKNDEFDTINNN